MSWLCTSSSASFFHYGKVPELFRNTSGTKTEKLFFPERFRKRFSIWIWFFSFSVLLHHIGQEQLYKCFLRVSSLHVIYFVLYISFTYGAPPKEAPKISRPKCARNTVNTTVFVRNIGLGGGPPYIYIISGWES